MVSLRSVVLSFVLVVFVTVAVAVSIAAPGGEEQSEAAVPAGQSTRDFACVSVGIAELLVGEPEDYGCSFEGASWVCDMLQSGDIVVCILGEHVWTCAVFPGGGAADCTDDGTGEYYCYDAGGVANCDTDSEDLDYHDCTFGATNSYVCASEAGRLVCAVNPAFYACELVAGTPRLWADADCNGDLTARDNQGLLRTILSQAPLMQTEPCPDVGSEALVTWPGSYDEGQQGFDPDTYFGCVNVGTAAELLGQLGGDFSCNYAGSGWGCPVVVGSSVMCTSGLAESSCTLDVSEVTADCSDNQGGSHTCEAAAAVFDCSTESSGGLDFNDCSFVTNTYTCLTALGQFVCVVTFHHYDCLLTSGQISAWADVDCNGQLTTRDNQALLRKVLSQEPLSQTEPCPDVGATMFLP